MSEWGRPRRFWTEAAVAPMEDGRRWGVTLDGQPVRTPGRALLSAPCRAVAQACADEWAAQGERIAPATMPVTRALNSALDRVAPHRAAVAADVAAYAGSDLLCHRAPGPAALAALQAAAWDPWLAWSRERFGAPLICGVGVTPIAQPPESLARLAARVDGFELVALTALHALTALSGSLVLGLAVAEAALEPAEAWSLSRVDEDWQASQWGEDAEAAAAAASRAADFADAARLATLLREG